MKIAEKEHIGRWSDTENQLEQSVCEKNLKEDLAEYRFLLLYCNGARLADYEYRFKRNFYFRR